MELASGPSAEAVQSGEGEIGGCAALASDQLAAAPGVVLHPRWEGEVVRIAPDFSDVEGDGGHEVGEVLGGDFDHEVRIVHLAPELGFDGVTFPRSAEAEQGVCDEVMNAHVGAVPIGVMGEENDAWLLVSDDLRDSLHHGGPGGGVLLPGLGTDPFESSRSGLQAIEVEVRTGGPEFSKTGVLPVTIAALGDGDVDDTETGLACQSQCEPAHDGLVIGMRREQEGERRVGSWSGGTRGEAAERVLSCFAVEAGDCGGQVQIGIHRESSRKDGQAGGGDGLAVALVFFVRGVESDAGDKFGEFGGENLMGDGEHGFSAGPGRDAAEHQEVVEVVEIGEVGDGVAEVGADGLVDLAGPAISGTHQFLNVFEGIGELLACGDGDAGRFSQAADALLGEVLCTGAAVAGPFVDGGLGVVVDRHKRELIEPGCDRAFGGHVPARSAGAQRKPEDGVGAQRHGAGQSGDLAVVDDFDRDVVPSSADFLEEAGDALLERVGRDTSEKGGDLHLVVDVDAGGAPADGVDAGQVPGGVAEGVHDAVEVVLGVGLADGVPGDFLAIHDGAVDDGGCFAVTAAEVESDAAAAEVTPEGLGAGVGLGQGLRQDCADVEGVPIDALAHHHGVEAAGGVVSVVELEGGHQRGRSGDPYPESAARPEQELQPAFEAREIRGGFGVVGRKDRRVESERRAVGLFKDCVHGYRLAGFGDSMREGAVGQDWRAEQGIQDRRDDRCHEKRAMVRHRQEKACRSAHRKSKMKWQCTGG